GRRLPGVIARPGRRPSSRVIRRPARRVHDRSMNTRTTLLAIGIVAVVALPASTGAAHASTDRSKATPTVTIKAEGRDPSGTVKSPGQGCITDRKVIVVKQVGTRGGGDDLNFASDLASSDGSWDTGTTGTPGKFYAKVKTTSTCKGDTSPTIRARR